MYDEAAKEVYEKILMERGIAQDSDKKVQLQEEIIKEFKVKTNLSIRKIAAITSLNKDKVNKILKG